MPNEQSNLEQQFNQPLSSPNNLPQKSKFNLKYILIVVILAIIVGGGILSYQYWWLPKHEIKLPEITIKDETTDWQTYRNEEYGFEFKYPKEFSFIDSGQRAVNNDLGYYELGYLNQKDGGNLPIFIKLEQLNPNNIRGIYGKKDINDLNIVTVDGSKSYVYTEGDAGCEGDSINIPNGENTIILQFNNCEGQINYIREDLENQIISTFKFIPR